MKNRSNSTKTKDDARPTAVPASVIENDLYANAITTPHGIFKINDIDLVIPPTSIAIQKEDMFWQWKTLRSKTSTKVPSGRGVCNVHLTVVFTPDLILHLHRLIVQFKQSPFCYVENAFLRDSIVPHWPVWQNMAFTMVSLNVAPKKGNPGTFICELDLRWFNYFPYGVNFCYKNEWITLPVLTEPLSSDTPEERGTASEIIAKHFTIPTFGPSRIPGQLGDPVSELKMPNSFDSTPTKPVQSFSVIAGREFNNDKTKDLEHLIATHAGVAFDLLPLPHRMLPAKPTVPETSRIYVRYINSLQQRNLFVNFGIDIAKLLDESTDVNHKGNGKSEWDRYTNGWDALTWPEDGTLVRGLHRCKPSVRDQVIHEMLKYCGYTRFYYHQYMTLKPNLKLATEAKKLQDEAVKEIRNERLEEISEAMDKMATTPSGGYMSATHKKKTFPHTDLEYPDGGHFSARPIKKVRTIAGRERTHTVYTSKSLNPPPESGELAEIVPGATGAYTATEAAALRKSRPDLFRAATVPKTKLRAKVSDIIDPVRDKEQWTSYEDDFLKKPWDRRASERAEGGESELDEYFLYPPLRYAKVQSGFGWRDMSEVFKGSEKYKKDPWKFHKGIDLLCKDCDAQEGVPIFAAHAGTLSRSKKKLSGVINIKSTPGTDAKDYLETEYRHLHSFEPTAPPGPVKRGQIIGYVGTTGRSTGPHLHFVVKWKNKVVDPFPVLNYKVWEAVPEALTAITPTKKELSERAKEVPGHGTEKEEERKELEKIEREKAAAEEEAKKTTAAAATADPNNKFGAYVEQPDLEEVAKAGAMLLEELDAEGWKQYEEDWTVTNVWKRIHAITIAASNLNIGPSGQIMGYTELPHELGSVPGLNMVYCDDAVLTNVNGGLRHIVASIPLLGSEFPTHQHLGSVEPVYSFEITGLDRLKLDGLSITGQYLEGMRAELMRNAREFRVVPDSFALVTDHFITRLLGSFTVLDLREAHEETDVIKLDKRSCITAMSTQTVEGSPSVASIMLEISETNPYVQEEMTHVPQGKVAGLTLYQRRKKVLKVLEKLNLAKKGAGFARAAQLAHIMKSFGQIITTREQMLEWLESDDNLYEVKKQLDGSYKRVPFGKDSTDIKSKQMNELLDHYWEKDGTDKKIDGKKTRLVAFRDIKYEDPVAVSHYRSLLKEYDGVIPEHGVTLDREAAGSPRVALGGTRLNQFDTTVADLYQERDLVDEDIDAEGAWWADGVRGSQPAPSLPAGETTQSIPNALRVQPLPAGTTVFTDTVEYVQTPSGLRPATPAAYGAMTEEQRALYPPLTTEQKTALSAGKLYSEDLTNAPSESGSGAVMGLGELNHINYKRRRHLYSERRLLVEDPTLRKWHRRVNNMDTLLSEHEHFSNNIAWAETGEYEQDTAVYGKHAIPASSVGSRRLERTRKLVISPLGHIRHHDHLLRTEDEESSFLFGAELGRDDPEDDTSEAHSGAYVSLVKDASSFFDQYPDLIPDITTGAQPVDASKHYYQVLQNCIDMSHFFIAESGVDGALSTENTDHIFYGLSGARGQMFSMYLNYLGSTISNRYKGVRSTGGFTGLIPNMTEHAPEKLERLLGEDFWDHGISDSNLSPRDNSLIQSTVNSTVFSRLHDNLPVLGTATGLFLSYVGTILSFSEGPNPWDDIAGEPGVTKLDLTEDMPPEFKRMHGMAIQAGNKTFWLEHGTALELSMDAKEVVRTWFASQTEAYINKNLDFGSGIAHEVVQNFLKPLEPLIKRKDEDDPNRINYNSHIFNYQPKLMQIAMYLFGVSIRPTSILGFDEAQNESSDGYVFVADKGSYASQRALGEIPTPPAHVNSANEMSKAKHIEKVLSELADMMLLDTTFLNTYGLGRLASEGSSYRQYSGGLGAYPDLELPPHPYYPTEFRGTPPDFYMWNIYDDGNESLKKWAREKAAKLSYRYLEGSYDFLKGLQKDGLLGTGADRKKRWDGLKKDLSIMSSNDVGLPDAAALISNPAHHPDGTDDLDYLRPDATWIWRDTNGDIIGDPGDSEDDVKKIFTDHPDFRPLGGIGMEDESSAWTGLGPCYMAFDGVNKATRTSSTGASNKRSIQDQGQKTAFAVLDADIAALKQKISTESSTTTKDMLEAELAGIKIVRREIETITKNKQINCMVDLGDDFNPANANNPRADQGTYRELAKRLLKKVKSNEAMFGSKQGFRGEYLKESFEPTAERSNFADSTLATLGHYNHAFDKNSLFEIAKDSSKDIISQKLSLKRAYPTFKLYFVEEDESFDQFLTFDNFYNFNGVKEFTIHRSRRSAADTATIVLQNVAGTLDGTRRNTITDMDYFDKDRRKEIADSDSETNVDNASRRQIAGKDQPFGAVILRPGMNIQLRAGFSDDPNMLETLISGRVTDVTWNKNGDLTEIVVQSFGVELVKQVVPAMKFGDYRNEPFPTTHHLLGSLMLGPGLNHFGRWEKGAMRQPGEAQDSNLDFYDYNDVAGPDLEYHDSWKLFVANNIALMGLGGLLVAGVVTFGTGGIGRGVASGLKMGGGAIATFLAKHAAKKGALSGLAKGALWAGRAGVKTVTAPIGFAGKYITGGRAGFNISSSVTEQALKNVVTNPAVMKGAQLEMFTAAKAAGTVIPQTMKEAVEQLGKTQFWDVSKGFQWLRPWKWGGGTGGWAGSNAWKGEAGRLALGRILRGLLGPTTTASSKAARKELMTQIIKGKLKGDAITKALLRQLEATNMSGGTSTKALQAVLGRGIRGAEYNARTLATHAFRGGLAPAAHGHLGKRYLNLAGQVVKWGWEDIWGKNFTSFTGMFFKRIARGFTVVALPLIAASVLNELIFKPWYDKTWMAMRRKVARTKSYFYLDPRDDNLFPPPPTAYMKMHKKGWKEGLVNFFSNIGDDVTTIGGIMIMRGFVDDKDPYDNIADKVATAWNTARKPNVHLMEKRLRPEQCMYHTTGDKTLWEIFHEMSLRHPGWIYGARPYGHDFQYRMFFGVGSQRYWAKPASNDFLTRMILLHEYIKQDSGITVEKYLRAYSIQKLGNLPAARREMEGDPAQLEEASGIERVPELEAYFESDTTYIDMNQLQIEMKNDMMYEYLRGLEVRFQPFRRYHSLSSGQDLVWNGITSSEHNVVNAVEVSWFAPVKADGVPSSQPKETTRMKAHSHLAEDKLRVKSVSYKNCKGYTMALRYGMGELMYGMKQMYRGEILVLGNPRIQPWDICILMDHYNDMAGPIEVEAVTHMFSHETGYLTEIKPNAVVFGNEISSWPILEALKVWQMAVDDQHNHAKGTEERNTELTDLAGESWKDPFVTWNTPWPISTGKSLDSTHRQHVRDKYLNLLEEGWDLRQIFKGGYDGPPIEDETSAAFTGVGFLATTTAAMLFYGLMRRVGGSARVAKLLAKTPSAGPAKTRINLINDVGNPASSKWAGFFKSMLGISAGVTALHTADDVGKAITPDFRIESMQSGRGLSWLIASPVLFSKCMEEEVIVIVPLVKAGRPIVSGLEVKDPFMIWKNVIGDIRNVVEDTITGTADYINEWTSDAHGFYQFLTSEKPELGPWFGKWDPE